MSYQWKKAGVDIPGATTTILAMPSVDCFDGGSYMCSVTNPGGVGLSSVALLVIAVGCTTELVRPDADWQAQDYQSSRAITGVVYDAPHLVASGNYNTEEEELRAGEILLDLKFVAGTEGIMPFDLSASTITIRVTIPEGFVAPIHAPNGVQIIFKDQNWKGEYSGWTNIVSPGQMEISFRPSTETPPNGHMDAGFDPTHIRLIGIKFGINTNNHAVWTYNGSLSVESVSISGVPDMTPDPVLSVDVPAPVFDSGDVIALRQDGFYLNDRKWFIVAANWEPLEYGQAFGVTAWYPLGNGIAKHAKYVQKYLELAARAGIKVLRVPLIADGRVLFDIDGHVAGYDATFRADVVALLDRAQAAGVKIELTLVDFLLAGKADSVDGVWVRGRPQVFTDEGLRTAFINDFLTPFATEFGGHAALFGIDFCNEPEWILAKADGGAWEDYGDALTKPDQPISGAAFRAFVDVCATAIRAHAPRLFLTVGTSITYAALVEDLDLDYLGVHHYASMGAFADRVAELPAGHPWSLEEYPTRLGDLTMTEYLDATMAAGGVGAGLWNLRPEFDDYTVPFSERNSRLEQLRAWVDAHADAIFCAVCPIPPAYQTHGLGFSPILEGQTPGPGLLISKHQIRSRMRIVAPHTRWVRSYSCSGGLEHVGRIAHELGLQAAIGAWIDENATEEGRAKNQAEVDALIGLIQAGDVDLAIVGNEALLRRNIDAAAMVAYINQVKAAAGGVPVTTADAHGILLDDANASVMEACDVVLAHCHPYWEEVRINWAVETIHREYQDLRAAAGSKPVLIGETGWPSAGNTQGDAVPTLANACALFLNFVSWARANDVAYFYFEAFDEPWKATPENPQEAHWGVWDKDAVLKPCMASVFDDETVPDNWSGTSVIGGPGVPSLAFTDVPPIGEERLLSGVVMHCAPVDYRIAVYIKVSGLWYTKPTYEERITRIHADGVWQCDIFIHKPDILNATDVAAFLIPATYTPPELHGDATFPGELLAFPHVTQPRGAD